MKNLICLLLAIILTSGIDAQSYCTELYSTGTISGDFMSDFTLGAIHQTSAGSAAPFYNYYSSSTTNLVINSSYTLSITSGSYSSDRYSIFIDYNNDGDFLDSDELIDTLASISAYQTMTSNFMVPSNVTLGTKRLRVICTFDSWPTPCDTTLDYGETQDYNVEITNSNTFAPVASFSASSTTISTIETIQFTDLSANLPTSWNWTFSGGNPSTSNQQNPGGISYTTPGDYAVSLTVSNANGANTATYNAFIHVIFAPSCYVNLNPSCDTSTLEYISYVGITATGLNNYTSCSDVSSNYSNFAADTSLNPILITGNSYTLQVTSPVSSVISCWIDYNHNYSLEANEWIQVDTASIADSLSSVSFTVPSNALLGNTIMRIRSCDVGNSNGAADACTEFFSGETEDYLIRLIDMSSIKEETPEDNVLIYPNPARDKLYIKSQINIKDATEVQITDALGNVVKELRLVFDANKLINEICTSELSIGFYFLNIRLKGGVVIKRFVKN
jgi:PKD repeat protein